MKPTRFPSSFQEIRLVFGIPSVGYDAYENRVGKILDIPCVTGVELAQVLVVIVQPDSMEELRDIHREIKRILKKH